MKQIEMTSANLTTGNQNYTNHG